MKRYRARMQHTHNFSRAEKQEHARAPIPWYLLFNKTTLEVCVLSFLIGSIVVLAIRHPYFQITDIRVDGVDTYAATKVKTAIDNTLRTSFLGTRTDTYLLFQSTTLDKAIRTELAVDAVQIIQRFPHTLIIHASERPIAFKVVAPNGVALIGPDGTLVRWYEPGNVQEVRNMPYPTIEQHDDIGNKTLLATVIDSGTAKTLSTVVTAATHIRGAKLTQINLADETKTASMQFDTGLVITVRLDADIDIQLQKAELSVEKYLNAKRIDARFGDKVFISF